MSGRLQTRLKRWHVVGIFEGVLRRDEPPYFVQLQALVRLKADMAVTVMRRIERPA